MTNKIAAVALSLCLWLAPGAANAQFMDIVSIIGGIGGFDFLEAVERVDTASSVRTVRISTLAGAEQNADRLASAVAGKPRDIAHLHSNIAQNPIAMRALRNAGFSLGQVVSLIAERDGAAVLFVDDL
jgi:hypothetical protein